jgi:hypothetical protein
LKAALTLEVAGISSSARKAVEEAGGSVTVLAKKTATAKSAEGVKKTEQAKSPEKKVAKAPKKAKAADKQAEDDG